MQIYFLMVAARTSIQYQLRFIGKLFGFCQILRDIYDNGV